MPLVADFSGGLVPDLGSSAASMERRPANGTFFMLIMGLGRIRQPARGLPLTVLCDQINYPVPDTARDLCLETLPLRPVLFGWGLSTYSVVAAMGENVWHTSSARWEGYFISGSTATTLRWFAPVSPARNPRLIFRLHA